MIGRREFITLLGGAAAAWPLAARAQQPAMPVIGFLSSATAKQWARLMGAFLEGLSEAEIVVGRDVTVEYRWAEGQYDRLPALAAGLVQRHVSVIAALTTPAAVAAKAATGTIPIVFSTIGDPVQIGLVASLRRPGGNITGATYLNVEVGPKLLELLHEVVPTATTVAALVNPTNPNAEILSNSLQVAARTLGLELHLLKASTERDINTAFETLIQQRVGGLVVPSDVFLITYEEQLAVLALRHRVLAISQTRAFAAAGGLMSYAGSALDAYRQAGAYTGRVLKGEKPADLPVQQTTKVELIVNLKTAKALGLDRPASAARPRRRGDRMKRREFITLLGGAAAWPLAARAQQPGKLPIIGFLGANTPSVQSHWIAAFVQRLRELGWIEGRNVAIEYRWAETRFERSPEIIAEFVRLKVDVIVTHATANILAAKQGTSVIPIVFAAVADPVSIGVVDSLARPGRNVTGLSNQFTDAAGKRVELMREVVPGLRRLAILANVGIANAVLEIGEVQAAARTLGLEVATFEIGRAEDIAPAFAALKGRAEAVYVFGEPLVNTNRTRISALALDARLPTVAGFRELVDAGGLISYGTNLPDLFRRAADYVDKILRGAKPGDLPVEQPTKFDLVINLKTAKALGLEVPPTLLARADEVIE